MGGEETGETDVVPSHDDEDAQADGRGEEEQGGGGKGGSFAVQSKGPTFFGLVGLIETKFPKKAVADTPKSITGAMDASMDKSGEILAEQADLEKSSVSNLDFLVRRFYGLCHPAPDEPSPAAQYT